ncbi:hypothetical protein AMECASPLE_004518 [Ameca splendens]|uniref:Uncharacterized protein n=1 Tax=Ameca splendens TaxID=208324 RepID=A0ABV0XBX2_9TELE
MHGLAQSDWTKTKCELKFSRKKTDSQLDLGLTFDPAFLTHEYVLTKPSQQPFSFLPALAGFHPALPITLLLPSSFLLSPASFALLKKSRSRITLLAPCLMIGIVCSAWGAVYKHYVDQKLLVSSDQSAVFHMFPFFFFLAARSERPD